jgi:ribosome biogenesis GTPase
MRQKMNTRRRKAAREKDITSRFLSGEFDEDRMLKEQRLSPKGRGLEQSRIERTALNRAIEGGHSEDIDKLPIGQVVQVFSLFCDVQHPTGIRRCVIRKTLTKLSDTQVVVGDEVRFRDSLMHNDLQVPESVIEQVMPRRTVLTRTGSFHTHEQQAIVANADQVLIVVSLAQPAVKWGLVDRMIVAAQSGGLTPLVCLNKIDLAEQKDSNRDQFAQALLVLDHYVKLGIGIMRTSAETSQGIGDVAAALKGRVTVLAGHSGVGKSTLISAVQPGLDIRVGAVSSYNEKGRHTTTSARRYALDMGGYVIDTPGVKLFGLWQVNSENLLDYFPDVQDETAPPWRLESYQRILESMK